MKDAAYIALNNTIARTLKTPQYIILFVSDKCWMHCSHCWFSEEWKDTNLNSPQMTFDEYERLADSIDRLTFLSLTGGEAFIRPDIVDITHLFARKTRLHRYQIPSSGFRTDMILEKTEKMLKLNPGIPFRVDVSLDGAHSTHDIIRNKPGVFDAATETIRSLNKLKKKYAYFDVGVITTISNRNQHEVEEISETIDEIHPDGEWMVNITRGKPRDPTATDVDLENYERAHNIIEERICSGKVKGHSGHRSAPWLTAKNATRRKVIMDTVRGHREGGACAAGSLGSVIYSDGQVHACEMLDDTFGNLRDFDYNLGRMWNSSHAREVRRKIQETRCICTQECFLSVSLLIQPQRWPDIISERMRLGKVQKGMAR